jgi:hypothetical protein
VAFTLVCWRAGSAQDPAAPLSAAKPIPRVQVIPLPYDQASFQWDGQERTRYHFGPGLERPFWYPIVGPDGQTLTRMGHPHDPNSHRHHYSVWISHEKVNGVNFWADGTGAKIVCKQVARYEDGDDEASMLSLNAWQDKDGKAQLLERRRTAVRPWALGSPGPAGKDRPDAAGDWLMVVDLQLESPGAEPVVLEESAFGLIGVRMAKTIGVHDGGGRILNSEGQVNEPQVFRKPARWVDYSGAVGQRGASVISAGITLMDHPSNPGHPTPFHVRDDGWMGASLTLRGAVKILPGQPLRLRYGLWAHRGVPTVQQIDPRWEAFCRLAPAPAGPRGK